MTDASSHGPHSSGDRSSFGFRDVDAREKVKMVRGVFDSVASNYDVMNDLMSVGVHRVWKDIAAAKLNPRPGETILDVAGGTGDMARRYSKMARAAQERAWVLDVLARVHNICPEGPRSRLEPPGGPPVTHDYQGPPHSADSRNIP